MAIEKTVKFLDREYDLKRLLGLELTTRKGTPLVKVYDYGNHYDYGNRYEACTSSALYNLRLSEDGATPQRAASKLEKRVLLEFKKIGIALGYEVED